MDYLKLVHKTNLVYDNFEMKFTLLLQLLFNYSERKCHFKIKIYLLFYNTFVL